MSASCAPLVSTVNFVDRLMQLGLVVQDSYAEVEPDFRHQMTRVTLIMGFVLLGITVKKEQQMAHCVLKEH